LERFDPMAAWKSFCFKAGKPELTLQPPLSESGAQYRYGAVRARGKELALLTHRRNLLGHAEPERMGPIAKIAPDEDVRQAADRYVHNRAISGGTMRHRNCCPGNRLAYFLSPKQRHPARSNLLAGSIYLPLRRQPETTLILLRLRERLLRFCSSVLASRIRRIVIVAHCVESPFDQLCSSGVAPLTQLAAVGTSRNGTIDSKACSRARG
jgi:hypothetical protein